MTCCVPPDRAGSRCSVPSRYLSPSGCFTFRASSPATAILPGPRRGAPMRGGGSAAPSVAPGLRSISGARDKGLGRDANRIGLAQRRGIILPGTTVHQCDSHGGTGGLRACKTIGRAGLRRPRRGHLCPGPKASTPRSPPRGAPPAHCSCRSADAHESLAATIQPA